MTEISTAKIDELFRQLPVNSGMDPRLVDEAKTELNVLKFRAGVSLQGHKQTWTRTDADSLRQQLLDKETELQILKSQLRDSGNSKFLANSNSIRRPDEISASYRRLYDTEWVAVYDFFKQRGWTEIEIVVTLQRILRASYSFCKDVSLEQLENIEGEAIYPTATWMDDDCIVTRMKQKDISHEILDLAKLYQRTTAQECLRSLQKTFRESVLPTFIDPSQYNNKCINVYTDKCVELTWSMCVQDPPMVFIDKLDRGAPFDTDTFRKFTKDAGDKFDYLVWPALLLNAGGSLIAKGIAEPIKFPSPNMEGGFTSRPLAVANPPSRARSIPLITRNSAPQGSRNPEDWVDLESNPGDRATPDTNRMFKRENDNDVAVPKSPYFSPNSPAKTTRTPRARAVPSIKIEHQSQDGTRGRYARSANGNAADDKLGNLTVAWKNDADMTSQDRRTSAP